MEVIPAQRVSNSVAGFLRARRRTRSSDLENHRPTFDGHRVVGLSQALDKPISFSVVPGLPEPDASRDPPPLLGRTSILEGLEGSGHLGDELVPLLGRAEHLHDDDTGTGPSHVSMIPPMPRMRRHVPCWP